MIYLDNNQTCKAFDIIVRTLNCTLREVKEHWKILSKTMAWHDWKFEIFSAAEVWMLTFRLPRSVTLAIWVPLCMTQIATRYPPESRMGTRMFDRFFTWISVFKSLCDHHFLPEHHYGNTVIRSMQQIMKLFGSKFRHISRNSFALRIGE